MSLIKKSLFLLTAVVVLLNVTACNTLHGLGKDIERGGEKIQKSSDAARR